MSFRLPDQPHVTDADAPAAGDAALARDRIRRWNPQPGSATARLLRAVMTEIEAWRFCQRRDCGRARRCAAARVDCFAHHHAFVCAELRPRLVAALREANDK